MVWVTKAGDEGIPGREAVGREVVGLDRVSEVDVRTEGSVMRVSSEGARPSRRRAERAVREAQVTRSSRFAQGTVGRKAEADIWLRRAGGSGTTPAMNENRARKLRTRNRRG